MERRWIKAPDYSRVAIFNPDLGLSALRVNEAAEGSDSYHPDFLGRAVAWGLRTTLTTQAELDAEADRLFAEHCRARRFVETNGVTREVPV